MKGIFLSIVPNMKKHKEKYFLKLSKGIRKSPRKEKGGKEHNLMKSEMAEFA